jgi:hypothetical protein
VKSEVPGLVIESQISNVSYSGSLEYPSDGRYFEVILSRTGAVINKRDEVVTGAMVILQDDSLEEWPYTESPAGSGRYYLFDDYFQALPGKKYRMMIYVTDEESYESNWEQLPASAPGIGEICFEETEMLKYVIEAGNEVINSIPVIQVGIKLPKIESTEFLFYRWDFDAMWIYEAPFPSTESNKICWAVNDNYISNYTLQRDNVGGYTKELLHIEVPFNERILSEFSVLVKQYTISQQYYGFWDELKKQTERGSIFDAPAYNLQSNFKATAGDLLVSGYFGVVQEQAVRWYFNIGDLSYFTEDFLKRVCMEDIAGPGFPAPECLDCLGYSNGTSTNIQPEWWGR